MFCALLTGLASAGSALAQGRTERSGVGPFVGGYVFDNELVRLAISAGEVLEDYPDDPRGHSCLLLGRGACGEVLLEELGVDAIQQAIESVDWGALPIRPSQAPDERNRLARTMSVDSI